ncbi:hypothetical protein CUMW_067610 [Citrus unshiu]|nr:hypothetical protein CUMW_067610 [Citrus unshiu]
MEKELIIITEKEEEMWNIRQRSQYYRNNWKKMESYISRNGMAGSDIGTSTQVRLQQGRRCLWVVLFLSHNARCDDSSCHSTCTLDHLWVRVFSIIPPYPDAY